MAASSLRGCTPASPSAGRTLSLADSVGCSVGTGTPFFDVELLRRLSRLLVKVFVTAPPFEVLFSRILPLASTWADATVLLPKPGVLGAPGFSSEASSRYHRRPSESSN